MNWNDKINEIIDRKIKIQNGNSSKMIIQKNCSSFLFDRLSILFDLGNYKNKKLIKFWFINEIVYIYEWINSNNNSNNNLQIKILNNLEYQFEKSLIYNNDFQMNRIIRIDSLNLRSEPSIGYRPINRIENNTNTNTNTNNNNNSENYHPSIVFEIGYYQSLDDLFEKSEIYLTKSNNIRIIILIKFWLNEFIKYENEDDDDEKGNNNNNNDFKALAILFLKNKNNNNNYNNFNNKPIKLISFGNNHNIDNNSLKIIKKWSSDNNNNNNNNIIETNNYKIELPISELYHNVPIDEISINQKNIIIDLNQLKNILNKTN